MVEAFSRRRSPNSRPTRPGPTSRPRPRTTPTPRRHAKGSSPGPRDAARARHRNGRPPSQGGLGTASAGRTGQAHPASPTGRQRLRRQPTPSSGRRRRHLRRTRHPPGGRPHRAAPGPSFRPAGTGRRNRTEELRLATAGSCRRGPDHPGLQWPDGAGCAGTSADSPRGGTPVFQVSARLLVRRRSRPSER